MFKIIFLAVVLFPTLCVQNSVCMELENKTRSEFMDTNNGMDSLVTYPSFSVQNNLVGEIEYQATGKIVNIGECILNICNPVLFYTSYPILKSELYANKMLTISSENGITSVDDMGGYSTALVKKPCFGK